MKAKRGFVLGLNVVLAVLGLAAFVYLAGGDYGSNHRAARPAAVRPKATPQPASSAAQMGQSSATGPGPIRIGWTAWTDAEVVTNIARAVLEERMGYDVRLVMADIGIQYQGVATGELDAMLMAWLPVTHQSYWKRFSQSVVNLGPVYTRARLGWAVPSYVSKQKLASLSDLSNPAVQRQLAGRIYGIDPGSGLMQASERAMQAYGLEGLKLVPSSGAAMTAALSRAIQRREWIVVTAWSPHWMFAKWHLRYLKDPKGILGGRERVHVLVRKGFYQDYPSEVTELLTRMYLPLDELQKAMLQATQSSVKEAVDSYLREHQARVDYWVTGDIDEE